MTSYRDRIAEARRTHMITWWVYAGDQRIRRTAQMRGHWDYDATCSCGWDSRTGGATVTYAKQSVEDHLIEVSA